MYLNETNEKLEIYIFYTREDFEIENQINKLLVAWEENYHYFPETFIYSMDTIDAKASVLPASARKM